MDFDFPLIDTSSLVPDIPDLPDLDPDSLYIYSDTQFEILKKYIQEFEASLDPDHEVALKLTNFGQTITMIVTDIWYERSVILVFKGYVNGKMSTLIQHVNQLNLLLTSVDKDPGHQKRPIGFQYPSKG